jgi:hypothetical protein
MRKRFISALLAVVMILTGFAPGAYNVSGATFSDTAGHWAEQYISKWTDAGVIVGFGDGTFRPDANVTKAEFSSVLNQIFKYTKTVPNTFADVKDTDWFATIIEKVVAAGVVSPDANNMIYPNKDLTRGELFVMIAKAFNIQPISGTTSFLDDATIDSALKPYVKALQDKGLIVGYQNNSGYEIRTNRLLTRAEMLTVLDKAYEGINNPLTITPTPTQAAWADPLPPGRSSGMANINFAPTVSPTPTLTPEEDAELDTDKDQVKDYLEEYFGSSKVKDDTDDDGLSDYIELFVLHLDPTNSDTDSMGVLDGNRDADEDGLSNLDECTKYNTSPVLVDTDRDGISDYDEIFVHHTDPLLSDTDGDGLIDGDEIKLGLDPTKSSTDNSTPDAERKFPQDLDIDNIDESLVDNSENLIPSITGEVSGLIGNNVWVEKAKISAFDENRSVISKTIRIKTDYPSDTLLTLSFDYDNLLAYYDATYMDNLVICGYSEDGVLTPYETIRSDSDHTISASVPANGIYFVINVESFLRDVGINVMDNISDDSLISSVAFQAFDVSAESLPIINSNEVPQEWYEQNYNKISDDPPTYQLKELDITTPSALSIEPFALSISAASDLITTQGQADIVFVIDSTGSMSGTINNVARNIVNFVERLHNEYNVNVNFALVDFKDITYDGTGSTVVRKNGISNWFSDASSYEAVVRSIYVNGGGDDPETPIDALETTRRLDWRSTASKFIILATDVNYKNNNRYGIADMDEMTNLLKEDGIITSVVAPTYFESVYHNLYTLTNGVFADIYGNFADVLLTLADKIGEETSEGTWVLLKDFQYIKLTGPDTDNDGLSDTTELGVEEQLDITRLIEIMCIALNVPYELYVGPSTISVYNYTTNPILPDTDFDGINDGADSQPLSNSFTESFNGNANTGKEIKYTLDYRDLVSADATYPYSSDLSTVATLFAATSYNGQTVGGKNVSSLMAKHGLQDIQDINLWNKRYSDYHLSEAFISHKTVTLAQGLSKEVIVISVRGTNGTLAEWSSNFNVGGSTMSDKPTEWIDKENELGFEVATNRLLTYINPYLSTYAANKGNTVILVTGHSRGAAIGNIMSAKLTDEGYNVYGYLLATPNTTTKVGTSSYDHIYNIVNSDDFVPTVPMEAWSFTKYGRTAKASIAKKYQSEWHNVGDWTYNNDADVQNGWVTGRLATIADNRDECYTYNLPSDDITIRNNGISRNSRENAIAKIPANALPFCVITRFDGGLVGGWDFTVKQTPMYFMQIAAAASAGEGNGGISPYRFVIELNIADHYEKAKNALIETQIPIFGGVADPHFTESYYVLSKNITSRDFSTTGGGGGGGW